MLDRRAKIYATAIDHYTFRVAGEDDVENLVSLWPEHWAESHYKDRGIEPDEERYRDWIATKIAYDTGFFLLVLEYQTPIGFMGVTLDHNFSKRPVAVMGSFFVRKKHRRSAVPALIYELAMDLLKEEGACAFHVAVTSESASSQALINSLTKRGFKPIGVMMGIALGDAADG